MAIVNKFNVNKQEVRLDADIIENMSANDVSYNASIQYDENTVGDKLSELEQKQQIQAGVYDVTTNNDGATFSSLSVLLSDENLSVLIPVSVRCGGMSIRFVQSSDNKYVQYRLITTSFSADKDDWQGVDITPTANSNNLVESGGVTGSINSTFVNSTKLFTGGNVTFRIEDFPNEGRYLVNGVLSQSGWYHTDLYQCEENTNVEIGVYNGMSTGTPVAIFYNENQEPIGNELADGSEGYSIHNFTTISGTKYIRLQTAIKTPFTPYGTYLFEQVGIFSLKEQQQSNITRINNLESNDTNIENNLHKVIIGGNLLFKSFSLPDSGRYLVGGTYLSNGYNSGLIRCQGRTSISLYVEQGSSPSKNLPCIIFYNESQEEIGYELLDGSGLSLRTVTTPSDTVYIRVQSITKDNGEYFSFNYSVDGEIKNDKDIENLQNSLSNTDNKVDYLETKTNVIEDLFVPELFTLDGFINSSGAVKLSSGYKHTDYLDISNIKEVEITISSIAVRTFPVIAWFSSKSEEGFLSGEYVSDTNPHTIRKEKPSGANYMILSTHDNNITNVIGLANVSKMKEVIYISPTGTDGAAGNEVAPLKTLFAAKTYSANEVVFLAGDYLDFDILFFQFRIFTFMKGARLISGTRFYSATSLENYTRVYQTPCERVMESNEHYLFQHDVNDEETLITDAEYIPIYHNGRTHRLSSTRLYPATSIDEIENTQDKYMWYITNNTLYFSCPSSDFINHPIVIPYDHRNTYNSTRKANIEVNGLTILYKGFNSYRLNGKFNGGFVGFVNTAGFRFDSNINLEVNNFETCACDMDGFGGGLTDGISYDIIMHNCYSHDNADDGESGHVKTNVYQYGGLYEYNGNGLAPTVGANASYYNVISRFNGVHPWTIYLDKMGFYAIAQGDINSYMLCVGCLSEGNDSYGFSSSSSTVNSLCINCVSKNDGLGGFMNVQTINCTTIND